MRYSVVTIHLDHIVPYRDLLVDLLGNNGPYESFEETADGLKGYVPTEHFNPSFLTESFRHLGIADSARYEYEALPDKDWNEVWEREYQPVLVEDFCWVRAPFHPVRRDVEYDIVINPKMSFGTAHHATTYMMLSLLHKAEIAGRQVLDMGCGTAVLAILSAMRGAAHVDAVDIDEWAYRNALENCKYNKVESKVRCLLSDASSLPENQYDIVLANINRNILLSDMERYCQAMRPGATLLLSGFYESDAPVLTDKAISLGLQPMGSVTRDGWMALQFSRI